MEIAVQNVERMGKRGKVGKKKNKRKSLVHALITQCQSTPFKCKQLSIFQCD